MAGGCSGQQFTMKKKFLTISLFLVAIVAFAASTISTRLIGDTLLVKSRVVSGRSCKLYAVCGYNASASTQYMLVFETNALPADGTFAKLGPFPVLTGQFYSIDLSTYGADMDYVTVAASSTTNYLTLTSGTNVTIQAIISDR